MKISNILFVVVTIICLNSCKSYFVKVPSDDKWKSISAIYVTDSSIIEITQRGKLLNDERCQVRIVRSVPFQNLESLPDSEGLDELIKNKNCNELTNILKKTSTMPLTYLDSGPLDLTPKNSRKKIKISRGYALIVRTNSSETKIKINQIKQ